MFARSCQIEDKESQKKNEKKKHRDSHKRLDRLYPWYIPQTGKSEMGLSSHAGPTLLVARGVRHNVASAWGGAAVFATAAGRVAH